MAHNAPLTTLRSLSHELNKVSHIKTSKRFEETMRHVIGLYRQNQVTEKRYCRPAEQYKFVAETYLTYLQSLSKQNEITLKYFGRKDKSVEESAKLVGLNLPDRPF